jgi:hypothetical protein
MKNPFGTANAVIAWAAAASASGHTGHVGAATGYTITGFGKSALLTITLTPGVAN